MDTCKSTEKGLLEIINLLWKLFQRIRARHRTIANVKPQSWFYLLRTVNAFTELKGYTVTDLSHAANVNMQTMSEALKRLEKDGVVARKRCADDRRRVMVHLTAMGREIRRKIVTIRYQEIKSTLDRLDKEDQTELLNAINTMAAILSKVL